MRVILLGPPGAGKGTQATKIANALKVTLAASGDLFREKRQQDDELGQLVRSYYDKGLLVPDDVTIRLIMEWMRAPEQAEGFVLDGFPRTYAQAEALDKELESDGGLDKVLYINVPQEELMRRLGGRLMCRNCQTAYHKEFSPPKEQGKCDNCGGEVYQREDDSPEVVQRRIQVYEDETAPLVDYYKESGNLIEINGQGSIDSVGEALLEAVNR